MRRVRVVVLPAASAAVTLAVDRALGQAGDRLPGPVGPRGRVVERVPAATVTVLPGSAVPLNATARRALSTPASGEVSASFGAAVSTSNSQLLLTVRAKTLLLLK